MNNDFSRLDGHDFEPLVGPIDPNHPEHYIVGGYAGVFQTWDKGVTYDAVNIMAMGQFYGVSYDFQVPYRVCGGLQDNGTSCGLSRRANAPLQMTDWFAVNAADADELAERDGWMVWNPAIEADGGIRDGAWIAEATPLVDLSSWPAGSE